MSDEPRTQPTALEYWCRCMKLIQEGDRETTRVELRLPELFDINGDTVPLLVSRNGQLLSGGGECADVKCRGRSFLHMSLGDCTDIRELYSVRCLPEAQSVVQCRLLQRLVRETFWLEPNLSPLAIEAVTDLEAYIHVRVRGGEGLVAGGDWTNMMLRAGRFLDPESWAGRELRALMDYEKLTRRHEQLSRELHDVEAGLASVRALAEGVRLPKLKE